MGLISFVSFLINNFYGVFVKGFRLYSVETEKELNGLLCSNQILVSDKTVGWWGGVGGGGGCQGMMCMRIPVKTDKFSMTKLSIWFSSTVLK